MRRVLPIVAYLLALVSLFAVRAEFNPVAAIADTRWTGFLTAGAAALLFAWHYRRSERATGRRLALAGGAVSLVVLLFAAKLLFLTYREVPVSFANGEISLAGTLYLPRQVGAYPAVIFLHGSGRETRHEGRYHAKLFARHGFAALIYDKRGAGASSGNTYDATYHDYARDAVAAIHLLESHPEVVPDRIGVLGQSEGGWVAPLVAGTYRPSLSFVIVTSATHLTLAEHTLYETGAILRDAGFPEEVVRSATGLQARVLDYRRSGDGREALLADLEVAAAEEWFEFAGLPETLRPFEEYAWWRGNMDLDPVPEWSKVHCPVLAISGGRDLNSDAAESQAGISAALAAGGNDDFTGKIFRNMEHGNIEWWLPGRMPPPRFPRGYAKLLIDWTQAAAARPE